MSNYCWRALARQHPILYNSEKKARSVGCKIEDMRIRLCFYILAFRAAWMFKCLGWPCPATFIFLLFETPIVTLLAVFCQCVRLVVSIGKWSAASEVYVEDVFMSFRKYGRRISQHELLDESILPKGKKLKNYSVKKKTYWGSVGFCRGLRVEGRGSRFI